MKKGEKPKKRLWMMLDKDGLPLVVADSAVELAAKTGEKVNRIYSAVSHQEKRGYTPSGTRRPQKWAAVDDDDY